VTEGVVQTGKGAHSPNFKVGSMMREGLNSKAPDADNVSNTPHLGPRALRCRRKGQIMDARHLTPLRSSQRRRIVRVRPTVDGLSVHDRIHVARTSEDQKVLMLLSDDSERAVIEALARNPSTPAGIRGRLNTYLYDFDDVA